MSSPSQTPKSFRLRFAGVEMASAKQTKESQHNTLKKTREALESGDDWHRLLPAMEPPVIPIFEDEDGNTFTVIHEDGIPRFIPRATGAEFGKNGAPSDMGGFITRDRIASMPPPPPQPSFTPESITRAHPALRALFPAAPPELRDVLKNLKSAPADKAKQNDKSDSPLETPKSNNPSAHAPRSKSTPGAGAAITSILAGTAQGAAATIVKSMLGSPSLDGALKTLVAKATDLDALISQGVNGLVDGALNAAMGEVFGQLFGDVDDSSSLGEQLAAKFLPQLAGEAMAQAKAALMQMAGLGGEGAAGLPDLAKYITGVSSGANQPIGISKVGPASGSIVAKGKSALRTGDIAEFPSPKDVGPYGPGSQVVYFNGKPAIGLGHLAVGTVLGTQMQPLEFDKTVLLGAGATYAAGGAGKSGAGGGAAGSAPAAASAGAGGAGNSFVAGGCGMPEVSATPNWLGDLLGAGADAAMPLMSGGESTPTTTPAPPSAPNLRQDLIPPCTTDEEGVQSDPRFSRDSDFKNQSHGGSSTHGYRGSGSETNGGQQCIYDLDGNLIQDGNNSNPLQGSIDKSKGGGLYHTFDDYIPYRLDPEEYNKIQQCMRDKGVPSGSPGSGKYSEGISDSNLETEYNTCETEVEAAADAQQREAAATAPPNPTPPPTAPPTPTSPSTPTPAPAPTATPAQGAAGSGGADAAGGAGEAAPMMTPFLNQCVAPVGPPVLPSDAILYCPFVPGKGVGAEVEAPPATAPDTPTSEQDAADKAVQEKIDKYMKEANGDVGKAFDLSDKYRAKNHDNSDAEANANHYLGCRHWAENGGIIGATAARIGEPIYQGVKSIPFMTSILKGSPGSLEQLKWANKGIDDGTAVRNSTARQETKCPDEEDGVTKVCID